MLYPVDKVREMIQAGERLLVAGDEALLKTLPKGDWIGGTISYFMDSDGGVVTKDKVYVNKLPEIIEVESITQYSAADLPAIAKDSAENALNFIIVPANSPAHVEYATNAPTYEGLFETPTVGWVSGVHLDDLGSVFPKVFNGRTGQASTDAAVVLHGSLPQGKFAEISISNVFEPGEGDLLSFENTGFEVDQCLVNGKKTSLAKYIEEKGIDTRLPLVADYHGALVNSSIQQVDQESGKVTFYAPVFPYTEYRFAAPVEDYIQAFSESTQGLQVDPVFSCNCILNFLYSELEGKQTGKLFGPITFGEIAYQLLNQTLVSVAIVDI